MAPGHGSSNGTHLSRLYLHGIEGDLLRVQISHMDVAAVLGRAGS
jgi:hypothetical protein